MPNTSAVANIFPPVVTLPIPLDRPGFLSSLNAELAGALQDVVGVEEASRLIGEAGERLGREINAEYRAALYVPELSRAQLTAVLVDLKRRIQGDFYVVEEDEERIVFANRRCPFGRKVLGRPSMCMMTSGVFGAIAAENSGYSRVVLERTIAEGAAECRVVVYLKPPAGRPARGGHEYYGDGHRRNGESSCSRGAPGGSSLS